MARAALAAQRPRQCAQLSTRAPASQPPQNIWASNSIKEAQNTLQNKLSTLEKARRGKIDFWNVFSISLIRKTALEGEKNDYIPPQTIIHSSECII